MAKRFFKLKKNANYRDFSNISKPSKLDYNEIPIWNELTVTPDGDRLSTRVFQDIRETMRFNLPSLLLMGSSMISLSLSFYAWRRRQNAAVLTLSLLLAAATVWSFFYGVELALTDFTAIKIFTAAGYLGIAAIPVLWLIFAVRYAGHGGWLTPTRTALLFAVPAMTIILVATNDLHRLFYALSELGRSNGFLYHKLDPGVFWWIHVSYAYAALLTGITLFLKMFFRASRTVRLQIGFILAGVILPVAVNAAYVAGVRPYGFLDLTPIAFIGMGVVLSIGIFTVRLFDVTPLAMDMLCRHIPDAIFILNSEGKAVHVNPAARSLLASNPGAVSGLFETKVGNPDVRIGDSTYDLVATAVVTPAGNNLGTLIVLHDITVRKNMEKALLRELKEKELLLLETHHRIKNNIASIAGLLHMQAASVSDPAAAAALREAFGRVNSMAKLYDKMLVAGGRQDIPVGGYLGDIVDTIVSFFSGETTLSVDKRFDEFNLNSKQLVPLGIIVNELLTNSMKHAFAGRPAARVSIAVEKMGDRVRLVVHDDGQGLPEGFDIQAAEGFGLMLIRMMSDQLEGDLTVRNDLGTHVTLEFPLPGNP